MALGVALNARVIEPQSTLHYVGRDPVTLQFDWASFVYLLSNCFIASLITVIVI